jgi:hypothetical protein
MPSDTVAMATLLSYLRLAISWKLGCWFETGQCLVAEIVIKSGQVM